MFADREESATVIDVYHFTRKIKITNLTDDMISRAFGVKEKPDWEDYEALAEVMVYRLLEKVNTEEKIQEGMDETDYYRYRKFSYSRRRRL